MKGRVLAIDYGGKRTGLAVCDEMRIVAHPLPAIISTTLLDTVKGIAEVVDGRSIKVILCGIPFLSDGTEGTQVANVRIFLAELRKVLGPEILFEEIDERYTTKEAEGMWRKAGYSKKAAKEFLDSTAAVVILREYLAQTENY